MFAFAENQIKARDYFAEKVTLT